jgi:hypothetical protein
MGTVVLHLPLQDWLVAGNDSPMVNNFAKDIYAL